MELSEVLRRRRMVRSFEDRPVEPAALERILDAATRAPSAGFSQGTELLVLEGEQTRRYWDLSLPHEMRTDFPWPGLLRAPVLVVPIAHAQAYLDRYSEPDKAASGLGVSEDRWPVPYWYTDAAFGVMLALLAAEDEGLGALFFGIFFREAELMAEFGVPSGYKPIGTIAIGHKAPDPRSRSLARGRRPLDEVTHRGGW